MEIKEYTTNNDVIILWTASRCTHAAVCVKTLPKVYDPRSKPWIKPEMAGVEELKNQIDKCPSKALSYINKNNIK